VPGDSCERENGDRQNRKHALWRARPGLDHCNSSLLATCHMPVVTRSLLRVTSHKSLFPCSRLPQHSKCPLPFELLPLPVGPVSSPLAPLQNVSREGNTLAHRTLGPRQNGQGKGQHQAHQLLSGNAVLRSCCSLAALIWPSTFLAPVSCLYFIPLLPPHPCVPSSA